MDEPSTPRMDLPDAGGNLSSERFISSVQYQVPFQTNEQPAWNDNAAAPEPSIMERETEASPPTPLLAPAIEEPKSSEPKQPEPVRRRSTIREPAPPVGNAPMAVPYTPPPTSTLVISHEPSPDPAAPAAEESDAGRPRRTGWWARRLAGDKD